MSEKSNTPQIELLLVDDEPDFLEPAEQYFRKCGHLVSAVSSGKAAIDVISKRQFDVAVVDVHMPEMDGVQLLRLVRENDPNIGVIMLTGGATVPTAVASMKAGAIDYVTKPAKLGDLNRLIEKAGKTAQLQRENGRLRELLRRSQPKSEMIGRSPAIQRVQHLIERIAPSDKPVLIEGESGTGKELVARAIHAGSACAEKPLIVINCAALPESLLESELFGYEKGAFTGATSDKPGLFEMANGGTLFIDEFGELAGSLQAKLLRVLEDGVLRRVGSVKERRVHVRLIAATNKDLRYEVEQGSFREDLYYRVNVLGIHLPPLRDRDDDVLLLAKHFCGDGWSLDRGAIDTISLYNWPGNVRQLRNAIDRAKVLAGQSGQISADDLPDEVVQVSRGGPTAATPSSDLQTLNRNHVLAVLDEHQGNKTRAAKALGIDRRSLYRLLEKFEHASNGE